MHDYPVLCLELIVIRIPANASPYYRIMSFDPGTRTLGICVWEVNLLTKRRQIIFLHTLNTDKMIQHYPLIVENHGEKAAKLHAIEEELYYFMMTWDVHEVASEAPYFRRMVTAFRALVECILAERAALLRYNQYIELHQFDPSSVKNAVGVSGKSGDKELMRVAVIERFGHMVAEGIDIYSADEHSIDAVAIGHACIEKLLT